MKVSSDESANTLKVCRFSKANDADPFGVSQYQMDAFLSLPSLYEAEKMLIARVFIFMKCYRLEGSGMVQFKGQVINMEQDITSVICTLPSLATDIPIIIFKRPTSGDISSYADFRVRCEVILTWLRF